MDDEHPGGELDRQGQADEDSRRDAAQQGRPRPTEVGEAEQDEEGVDLTEPDPVGDRVQPQDGRGEAGQRDRPPPPGPRQQPVRREGDGRRDGEHLGEGPEPAGHAEGHEGERDGQDGRERRIGERQELGGLGQGGIDGPTGEDRDPGLAVDLDVALPLVERPEDEVAQHDRGRGEGEQGRRERPHQGRPWSPARRSARLRHPSIFGVCRPLP